jgi:hypothetical protein
LVRRYATRGGVAPGRTRGRRAARPTRIRWRSVVVWRQPGFIARRFGDPIVFSFDTPSIAPQHAVPRSKLDPLNSLDSITESGAKQRSQPHRRGIAVEDALQCVPCHAASECFIDRKTLPFAFAEYPNAIDFFVSAAFIVVASAFAVFVFRSAGVGLEPIFTLAEFGRRPAAADHSHGAATQFTVTRGWCEDTVVKSQHVTRG